MQETAKDENSPFLGEAGEPKKDNERTNSQERTYSLGFVACLSGTATIGGLLFGYDTGVISGASLFFDNTFPTITNAQKELIVSIALAGAAIGSFFGGPAADAFGRKAVIYFSDITFTIGAILMGFAQSISTLVLGRFFVGIGIGAAAMVVPVYLAEVSPKKIRGTVVTTNNLMVTFGQFFAYLICIACDGNWRLMLGLAGIPAVLQLFAMLFLPESPKWLMKNKQSEKALNVMKQIFHDRTPQARQEIQHEIEYVRESVAKEGDLSLTETYKQLFTIYKRSLFVGVMLQVWQQLAGINTAMYYGPTILEQAGWAGDTPQHTIVRAVPLGAINFLCTFVAVFGTDKLGRRWIMLRCLPLLALCMVGLSVGMYLIYFDNLAEAGSYVSVTSLFLYIAFFAPGMGPQPWTVNSEIYPLHLRGTAVSLSTTANWVANYAVSSVFLTTTESNSGKVITYLVIALFCVSAFVFIYFLLPETKEKSIDEIVLLFNPKISGSEKTFDNHKSNEGNRIPPKVDKTNNVSIAS